ncbi:hypothetical protein FPOAC2_12468 [Fusarium poae]|jgi:hypothetical protein
MTLLDYFLIERSARLKAQAYTSAGAPFTLEVSDGQAPLARLVGVCQSKRGEYDRKRRLLVSEADRGVVVSSEREGNVTNVCSIMAAVLNSSTSTKVLLTRHYIVSIEPVGILQSTFLFSGLGYV